MFQLHELGWTSFFQQHLKLGEPRLPARVIEEQRSACRVAWEAGELLAEVAGHLRHSATDRSGLPAVGDWSSGDRHRIRQSAERC